MDDVNPAEEDIFDVARGLSDGAARAAYLDRACGRDTELRRRLDDMLGAADEADAFFSETRAVLHIPTTSAQLLREVGLADATPAVPIGEEPIGSQIGRYRLLEKIGEGGCGVVYLAEQEEPVRRRVALKIIKLGMETKSVIARFEAERQALAMMDHPNIARVFDAGATDRGPPYFVMELVRGVRITTFCDQHQLDIGQRLTLFVQICHAIQHAHQKGIIHGDIKPSNIIVALHDGVPVPKVIDFGISKATEARLTEKLLFTAFAQIIGTPAYMSPEQAEMGGVDIDTRSDIYSLGVLLYELLAGCTPFDSKALMESGLDGMRRTLLEREPARPSHRLAVMAAAELAEIAQHRHTDPARLRHTLAGDLDWVVMKALEKDRARRYETANGLAMDVQRHLQHEPVMARPPSWLYRLQKMVRRNRAACVAGVAVFAALVMGMGATTWMFFREREARHRAVAAEQQQARLRAQSELREQVTQTALLVTQERFEEADSRLMLLPLDDPGMEAAAVFRSVGEWHALHGRWKQAADRFTRLLRVNHLDGADLFSMDYLECGPALLENGDLAGYERFRETAIARFVDTPTPFSDRILKISLLVPASPRILEKLSPLMTATRNALAVADAGGDSFTAAWRALSLGLAEYRSGNYAAAVAWCERCLSHPEANAPRSATAHLTLALAKHKLGRSEEARSALAIAQALVERRKKALPDRGTPVSGFWFDWAFAHVLLREANAQIAPTPLTPE